MKTWRSILSPWALAGPGLWVVVMAARRRAERPAAVAANLGPLLYSARRGRSVGRVLHARAIRRRRNMPISRG